MTPYQSILAFICLNRILKLRYIITDLETQLDNNNTESQSRQLGATFLVIGWITVIAIFALLLNSTLFGTKAPSISESDAGKQISIPKDYDSHFRVKGEINGIPVTFLIDTGATSIAISPELAKQANLSNKTRITMETANGEVSGYLTRIENLNIAGIEIKNVSAVIIPELDTALLGMNVLSKFSIQQTKDTLTLTVPAEPQ